MSIGISLEDFIEASIQAYKKGFNDAIRILIESEKTIDEAAMRESIKEILTKQGKVKNEWWGVNNWQNSQSPHFSGIQKFYIEIIFLIS